jgi:hypothetical protein
MNKNLAKIFFELTSKEFAFLVDEYFFEPPYMDLNEKINFVTVTFMGKNLAIECILDEREGDVDCKVARVFSGIKTNHYAVNDKGTRVREDIASLLRRRGVRGKLFSDLRTVSKQDRIRVVLSDFAKMLKKHAPEVLSDSPTSFD